MENWTGPVEPEQGIDVIRRPDTVSGRTAKKLRGKRWPEPGEIPSEWLEDFSAGTELARKSLELNRLDSLPPDKRLVLRHEREREMYRSIEEEVELPKLRQGFKSVDPFIALAVSALKRRKAHSRYSLEIAAREILQEEGLREGRHFTCRITARSDRWSGFVFPSEAAYLDPKFPAESLHMLVPETTCMDRWR